uniref:Uncharacterized protein n=1 Tax=Knipowitschia caucasica TaxID=637954 RepID=A0AAV2IVM2_KNICA
MSCNHTCYCPEPVPAQKRSILAVLPQSLQTSPSLHPLIRVCLEQRAIWALLPACSGGLPTETATSVRRIKDTCVFSSSPSLSCIFFTDFSQLGFCRPEIQQEPGNWSVNMAAVHRLSAAELTCHYIYSDRRDSRLVVGHGIQQRVAMLSPALRWQVRSADDAKGRRGEACPSAKEEKKRGRGSPEGPRRYRGLSVICDQQAKILQLKSQSSIAVVVMSEEQSLSLDAVSLPAAQSREPDNVLEQFSQSLGSPVTNRTGPRSIRHRPRGQKN